MPDRKKSKNREKKLFTQATLIKSLNIYTHRYTH